MPNSTKSTSYFPDTCIISVAGVPDTSGYYAISTSKGVKVRAHRLSYRMFNGPIPAGMVVMHSCDNPACINPRHLSIGTNQDNSADRNKKGRTACGVKLPRAKLTDDIVRHIRSTEMSVTALAAMYGVAKSCISSVRHRRNWKHVQDKVAV